MGNYSITITFDGDQAAAHQLHGDIQRFVGQHGVYSTITLQNDSWLQGLSDSEVCDFPASNQEITAGPPVDH